MEENQCVAHTKGIDPAGFVVSLTARDETLELASEQLYGQIVGLELTPWHDGVNMHTQNSLVAAAKELGGTRYLGEKLLPPKGDDGDTYDMEVSHFSYDGEYLKFYKMIADKESGDPRFTKYPVASLKLVEGNKDLEAFNQIFPDWGEPEVGSKLDLPMGKQVLSFVIGPNKKSTGNYYHNLVASRDVEA